MTPPDELAEDRADRLETELTVTEQLLDEQYKLMDLIPSCPAHGNRCVPYAVEWIGKVKTLGELIFKAEEGIK